MPDAQGKEQLIRLVRAFLPPNRIPTPDDIDHAIDTVQSLTEPNPNLFPEVTDEDFDRCRQDLRDRFSIRITIGQVLTDCASDPWLEDARGGLDQFYWNRYREMLLDREGWPDEIVNVLDRETDRILDQCGDPTTSRHWSRRGLVMGSVQSGKTANYLGLITKAADAGYRVIIVIAGLQDSLRNQTQERIDSGFLGYDSRNRGQRQPIGVGLLNPGRFPATATTAVSDFRAGASGFTGNLAGLPEPVVFVVKKNANVLNNLISWLTRSGVGPGETTIDAPMLLIDDEADNASINTRYDQQSDDRTRINSQLRALLKLFDQSSYVGYTATPFANIFIDPESDDPEVGRDLFPESFIVSLDPPSNYFGPQTLFETPSEEHLRIIDDHEGLLPLSHKRDLEIANLPESLYEAIRCFFLVIAIRSLRGERRHHMSMMINVSRFIDVQHQVWSLVKTYVHTLMDACRAYAQLPVSGDALGNRDLADLYVTWTREYQGVCPDWDKVRNELGNSAASIQILEINGRSKDSLAYKEHPKGRKVIAVGGLSLSRGLTLEGLSISYYLRNSAMYDTLMQMGRWFGYRPGYRDLVRVFMTEQSIDHYSHVTESMAELQHELGKMELARATPREFGLKVRQHPDTLMITARNKMGCSESIDWYIDLSNRLIETSCLSLKPDDIRANLDAGETLARGLMGRRREVIGDSSYLYSRVESRFVVSFLRSYMNAPASPLTSTDTILEYINPRTGTELAFWDVVFVGVRPGQSHPTLSVGGMTLHCQSRTVDPQRTTPQTIVGRKNRVASRGSEKIGLSREQINKIENDFFNSPDHASKAVPDYLYREKRERALLMIHYIKYTAPNPGDTLVVPNLPDTPIVAWSISFPPTDTPGSAVAYRLNAVAIDEWWSSNAASTENDEDDQ